MIAIFLTSHTYNRNTFYKGNERTKKGWNTHITLNATHMSQKSENLNGYKLWKIFVCVCITTSTIYTNLNARTHNTHM